MLPPCLSHRLSQSHSHATELKFHDFAQNIEICVRNLKKYAFLPLLQFFFVVARFPHLMRIFVHFYDHFLAQNIKIMVLTAQENKYLHCMGGGPPLYAANIKVSGGLVIPKQYSRWHKHMDGHRKL